MALLASSTAFSCSKGHLLEGPEAEMNGKENEPEYDKNGAAAIIYSFFLF
jgi:hypothetical protein